MGFGDKNGGEKFQFVATETSCGQAQVPVQILPVNGFEKSGLFQLEESRSNTAGSMPETGKSRLCSPSTKVKRLFSTGHDRSSFKFPTPPITVRRHATHPAQRLPPFSIRLHFVQRLQIWGKKLNLKSRHVVNSGSNFRRGGNMETQDCLMDFVGYCWISSTYFQRIYLE